MVYEYDTANVSGVDVAIYKAGYIPYFIRNFPLTKNGASIQVAQVVDRAYI